MDFWVRASDLAQDPLMKEWESIYDLFCIATFGKSCYDIKDPSSFFTLWHQSYKRAPLRTLEEGDYFFQTVGAGLWKVIRVNKGSHTVEKVFPPKEVRRMRWQGGSNLNPDPNADTLVYIPKNYHAIKEVLSQMEEFVEKHPDVFLEWWEQRSQEA